MLNPTPPPPVFSPAPASTTCPDGKPAFRDATATHLDPPQWPAAWLIGEPVSIGVLIDIDDSGKVTSAKVAMQSARLDNADAQAAFESAVLTSATHSQFSPKIVSCKPTAARYFLKVTFDPKI